jgi:hypothetical protein
MKHTHNPHAEHQLTQLTSQFDHWRQHRASRAERIPPALWKQAVALTEVLPISRVAKYGTRSALQCSSAQDLRSTSHPLQSRQRELHAFEDELPLPLAPRQLPVEALTLDNERGYETARNRVLLGPRLRPRGPRRNAPVAYLTGCAAQLALDGPDDCLDLMPLLLGPSDLLGGQAQPVRGVVLAAVAHHTDLALTAPVAHGLPIGVLEGEGEGFPLKAPLLLELADKVPAVIAAPLEQFLRGLPRVKEDQLRLTPPAMACIAQKLSGQGELGGSGCGPDTKGQGKASLPIRPYQEDDRNTKHNVPLLTRPSPGGLSQQAGIGLLPHRVVDDEVTAAHGKQRSQRVGEEYRPRPTTMEHPCQAVVRSPCQRFRNGRPGRHAGTIEHSHEVYPQWLWQRFSPPTRESMPLFLPFSTPA